MGQKPVRAAGPLYAVQIGGVIMEEGKKCNSIPIVSPQFVDLLLLTRGDSEKFAVMNTLFAYSAGDYSKADYYKHGIREQLWGKVEDYQLIIDRYREENDCYAEQDY